MEPATKCKGKSKKGVSVCPTTLDKVALGEFLHVVSYCVAVTAYAALRIVGCCMRVAAAYAELCMVGNYASVIAHTISCAMLGILSQFGCCI